ncbi:MAG: glycosyltransferase family 4 protein [Verrucomicrobiota bacterium]|nr:glycosyltransferase family 4 protein [Verrucomicrobiota bacterium]
MKICHIITRMIIGGAQENTLLTCLGLLEKGHSVTLLTGLTDGPEGTLLDKFNTEGLNIVVEKNLVRQINPLKDFKAYLGIKKYLKENDFDVVHTHSSKAGVIGRIAAKHAQVKNVFHTVHGPPFHAYEKKWKNKLYIAAERISAKYCEKIFTVADAMTKQFLNAKIGSKEMYKTVYSGMDIESFIAKSKNSDLKKSLNIPDDCKVIGKVARLFELKGHIYLIKAAEKVVKEYPNVRFLFVGDGILKNELQKKITDANLEKYFVFAGLISPEKVCDYIAIMDILVHLSLREGLPRAVVQGLATGKPVVGFPLDGTPEVILNNKTGILAETENPNSVADAILTLLRSPQKALEIGKNGQKLVKNKFDWHKMADVLEKEYLEFVNG